MVSMVSDGLDLGGRWCLRCLGVVGLWCLWCLMVWTGVVGAVVPLVSGSMVSDCLDLGGRAMVSMVSDGLDLGSGGYGVYGV